MELGYCHCCGTHNPPEEKKCKKCGAEIINLDRSSNIFQGLRSGVIAGAGIGVVGAILSALWGAAFFGATGGAILFVLAFIYWVIAGIIIGVIAGATSSLCFYQNIAGIGGIVGFLGGLVFGGTWYVNIVLGAATGYLASYIERKHFRKMTWL